MILSVSYIVKIFAFIPPDPPKYIIENSYIKKGDKIEKKEDILFLLKSGYNKLNQAFLDIKYYKIKNGNNFLPILIIKPKNPFSLCIIYCQGNSGDLGTSLFECFEISRMCHFIIVTFEYPGYGICKNDEITEHEFFKRIKNVYNYITDVLNFKPNQIILYGFSLGTGIAFDFACKEEFPVAGLILQSPFLSIIRTIYDINKTMYFDLFNNCDKAKKLCRQTLFIHGNHDTIVPYIHGRILAELIPKQYFFDFLTVHDADHNNLLKLNKEEIFKYIQKFILICTVNYPEINIKNISLFNVDNNEETRKSSDSSSFIKSENDMINQSNDWKKTNSSSKNNQKIFREVKQNSYINCHLNNFTRDSLYVENGKNNIKSNNFLVKTNNNYNTYYNMRYGFKFDHNESNTNQNIRNSVKIRQKSIDSNNNYYYVEIGTYSRNKKFSIYQNYIKKNNNNKYPNLIENSLVSINSSTNNINNNNAI